MSKFTHLDSNNQVNMVDVSAKEITSRLAIASGKIFLKSAFSKAKRNVLLKGDLLSTTKLSGIMAAKKTSELIPLCHQIPLSSVKIETVWNTKFKSLEVIATVKTNAQTGVEMEALTAVSISLLTVYDMCKAIAKDLEIGEIQLLSKSGGKNGDYEKKN